MKINVKIIDTNYSVNKYGKGVLENAIDEYIKNGNKLVSCNSNSTDLKDVIGTVEHIDRTDNGKVFADIELLDTPSGKIYQEILNNSALNFGVSGYGDKNEDGIITNFKINSINVI